MLRRDQSKGNRPYIPRHTGFEICSLADQWLAMDGEHSLVTRAPARFDEFHSGKEDIAFAGDRHPVWSSARDVNPIAAGRGLFQHKEAATGEVGGLCTRDLGHANFVRTEDLHLAIVAGSRELKRDLFEAGIDRHNELVARSLPLRPQQRHKILTATEEHELRGLGNLGSLKEERNATGLLGDTNVG